MCAKWAEGSDPAVLVSRLEGLRLTDKSGKFTGFKGFDAHDIFSVLVSSLVFQPGITEAEKAHIVNGSVFSVAKKGQLTSSKLTAEIRRQENLQLAVSVHDYVMLTTLSVSYFQDLKTKSVQGCPIVFTRRLPQSFNRQEIAERWKFGLGLAGILSLFVLPPINMGNIGSYRVAGLILATVYLLLFLSTMVTTSPVLQFLMHQRRDLVFGTKSLPKVINEADSALGGLRVTDALRDDYIAIILGTEELNEFTKNAEMTVSSIEQNIPNHEDDSTVADLKGQLVQTLLHSYQTWINDRIVRVQNVGKLIETYRKNARRILKTMYSAYPIVNQADSYINDAIQIADKKYNEMFDHYNETVMKLNLEKPKN